MMKIAARLFRMIRGHRRQLNPRLHKTTPSRVSGLLDTKSLNKADQMLDGNFLRQMKNIMTNIRPDRQYNWTALFAPTQDAATGVSLSMTS